VAPSQILAHFTNGIVSNAGTEANNLVIERTDDYRAAYGTSPTIGYRYCSPPTARALHRFSRSPPRTTTALEPPDIGTRTWSTRLTVRRAKGFAAPMPRRPARDNAITGWAHFHRPWCA
jgi:hypothetical protein